MRARVSIAALILFAAYAVYVVVASVSAGKGSGLFFWVSIVLIIALAVGALWLSRWFYRRTAKPS
jgi:branched-subunit amino acid ABC-type transport system permease component